MVLLSVLAAGIVAQTPVKGELKLSAGTGNTNPWGADLKLDIQQGRLTLKPFVGISGLQGSNNGQHQEIAYRYSASGSQYSSVLDAETEGQQYRYGLVATFAQSERTQWTMSVEGSLCDLQRTGHLHEMLGSPLLSSIPAEWKASINTPTLKNNSLKAEVGLRQQLTAPGSWGMKYTFSRVAVDEDMQQQGLGSESSMPFLHNHLVSNNTTTLHSLMVDYQHPLPAGQTLGLGARFDQRHISSDYLQAIDHQTTLDELFRHDMTVGAAFAEYRLANPMFNVNARLEYAYTRMNDHNLNDVIPSLRAQWNMSQHQSLALSYMMRLIRPEAQVLNPAHVRGAFTLDYGNPTLDGTHANVVAMAHILRGQRLRLTTTLSHIFADDGITAIWMVKDDVRVSTYGNEGIRRAWSLSPDMTWNIAPTTSLDAKVTVMWDKRVAEAIHMAKEHWGISGMLALHQQLPFGLRMNLQGEYSEGNTLDLYSHSSRQVSYGGDLQRSFLKGGRFTATLAYSNTDYAKVILTQGAYTGTVYTRPKNHHILSLTAVLKF